MPVNGKAVGGRFVGGVIRYILMPATPWADGGFAGVAKLTDGGEHSGARPRPGVAAVVADVGDGRG
jgi:hypothetical protein